MAGDDHIGESRRVASRLSALSRPDAIAHGIFAALASVVILLLVLFTYEMISNATLSLGRFGFGFLWTQTWAPVHEVFGVLPFIYGTLVTAGIAIVLSVSV